MAVPQAERDLRKQTRLEMREGKRMSKLHASGKFSPRKSQQVQHSLLHPVEKEVVAPRGLPPAMDPAVHLPRQHRKALRILEARDNPRLRRMMEIANEISTSLHALCTLIEGDEDV